MTTRNPRRKTAAPAFSLGLFALSCSLLAAIARANTVSESMAFRLNQNNVASTLSYTAFDTALGTLVDTSITFNATRRHAWAIWNVSGDSGSVPYDVALTNTTLTLDSNIFGFADLHYGPAFTPVLGSAEEVYSTEVDSGTAQFLAGMDPVFASAFHPATTFTSIAGGFAPSAAFDGTLNLAYAYDPGIFDIKSSNFLYASLVDIYGTATVTYTYDPVTVPDSPLGLWVAAVWLGMIAVARFHLSRPT